MRGNMYDGIWVDSCLGRYKGKNTVISDTRFPNEVKQIRLNGGTRAGWNGAQHSTTGSMILIEVGA